MAKTPVTYSMWVPPLSSEYSARICFDGWTCHIVQKPHWILFPLRSSFSIESSSPAKMCSSYLFTLLLIVALAFISPSQASVDSYRANGDSAGETKLYSNYIYVHAIFMAITFLFLVPIAIFASRFGRNRVGRKWFAVSFYFIIFVNQGNSTSHLVDACRSQRDSSLSILCHR
jgi:hypothetical protein